MSPIKKRRRRTFRVRTWSSAVLSALGLIVFPLAGLEEEAFAAGEIITVEPSIAAQGDFLTVTVSRISSSTFCSALPFIGDGYYMKVYLYDYENNSNYHAFPQTSELFNPSTQQSVTMRVGPIPSGYPLGRISVVGDCMYPDGRQTGNTAVPFNLTIVQPGQVAPAPDAKQQPVPDQVEAAPSAESDKGANGVNEPVQVLPEGSLAERIPRPIPQPAQSLAFTIKNTVEGGSAALHVDGFVPAWTTSVSVFLVRGPTETSVLAFSVRNGRFSEVVRIPDSTQPGEYTLRAVAERGCPPPTRVCSLSAEAQVNVSADSLEVLGQNIPRTPGSRLTEATWALWAVTAFGALLTALSLVWYRREKSSKLNN